jgi:hypothetical protein
MRRIQLKLVAVLATLAAATLAATLTGATGAAAAPSSSPSPTSGSSAPPTGTSSSTTNGTDSARKLTFGIGPALPVPSTQVVDGRPYLSFLASPGATIHDAVAIFNIGTKPVHLHVYAADATDTSTGDFALQPAAAKRTDAARWIRLRLPKSGTITVPARRGDHYGRVAVPFTARIPAQAEPGDHAAGIIASLQTLSQNKQGARVRLDQRIGVRTYFHLAGPVRPKVAVENLHAAYQRDRNVRGTGTITLSYVVHNTGNLRVNVSPLVTLSRWFSSPLHSYPPGLKDLLPGARVRVSQTIEDVRGFGPVKATVTLFPSPVDPTITVRGAPATAHVTVWAWPWISIAIGTLLLLLVLLSGGWWWRRHRRRARLTVSGSRGASPKSKKEPALARRSASAP